MKVRKTTLCHNCRRQKLSCDGNRPSCSNCVRVGRRCEGYPGLMFVPCTVDPAHQSKLASPSLKSTKRQGIRKRASPKTSSMCHSLAKIHSGPTKETSHVEAASKPRPVDWLEGEHPDCPLYRLLSDTTRDTISLVVRSYIPLTHLQNTPNYSFSKSSLVCGAWVEALPILVDGSPRNEFLDSAIKGLALSITVQITGKSLLQPIASYYGDSIHLLKKDLELSGNSYRNEHAAAIMCLLMSEILSPTMDSNWLVHIRGLGQMFNSFPPELFSTGASHVLFTGSRPLIVFEDIMAGRASFLSEEKWIIAPFRLIDPSPMQDLLHHAVHIPRILETINTLRANTELNIDSAKNALAALVVIAIKLEQWGTTYENRFSTPVYWPRELSTNENQFSQEFTFCFPDLAVGNVMAHLWALQIICYLNIMGLWTTFPCLMGFGLTMLQDHGVTVNCRQRCIDLSRKIFRTIPYLMQEEWMMYGPLSAGLPLRAARNVLEMDDEAKTGLLSLSKFALRCVDNRGFSFIYEMLFQPAKSHQEILL